MKIWGIILSIAGAICAVIGYIQYSSWEYQLASAFGGGDAGPQVLLYGGAAALVVGIIMLISGVGKEKEESTAQKAKNNDEE